MAALNDSFTIDIDEDEDIELLDRTEEVIGEAGEEETTLFERSHRPNRERPGLRNRRPGLWRQRLAQMTGQSTRSHPYERFQLQEHRLSTGSTNSLSSNSSHGSIRPNTRPSWHQQARAFLNVAVDPAGWVTDRLANVNSNTGSGRALRALGTAGRIGRTAGRVLRGGRAGWAGLAAMAGLEVATQGYENGWFQAAGDWVRENAKPEFVFNKNRPGLVLSGREFVGPGNPVDTNVPRSEGDAIAKEHDIAYGKAEDQEDIQRADLEAQRGFQKAYEKSGDWQDKAGQYGLGAKRWFENYAGVQYPPGLPPKKQNQGTMAGILT